MNNTTIMITGASVGIGAAIAKQLAVAGNQLIVVARRDDKLQKLQELPVPVQTICCDINQREDLSAALRALPESFAQIDVLINNAGLALGMETADQAQWQNWQTMIETNCLSLAYLTRQVLPGMVARNKGHIINMGSTAGSFAYKGGNVYGASKAFVEHFSKSLRADLLGSKVKVTNLEPGLLGQTEFSLTRYQGDQAAADAMYEGLQPLEPVDVAECVRWVLSLPEHVNINHLEIMPMCQASAGLAVVK